MTTDSPTHDCERAALSAERLVIRAAEQAARGDYARAQRLLNEAAAPETSPLFREVVEMFNLVMVKVEVREFELQEKFEELARINAKLQRTLEKVKILEGIKKVLSNFVSQSVKKIIEESPEALEQALAKRSEDVTILFLDVAGYTSLSQSVAPERMNHLIENYFSSFIDDIYLNGGDICEPLGDGLMLMFQHSDGRAHAVNAVRTALAAQSKMSLIHQGTVDHAFRLHIGAHSGIAHVGSTQFEGIAGARWTWTAYGMTVNLASRIGSKSRRGEILVSPETAKRIRSEFSLESDGIHVLKNIDEPIELFRVKAAPKEERE
jgi:class 3 adenylate cyclase